MLRPWAITRLWRNFTVRFKKGDSPGDGNSIKPIFGSVFNRCGFLPVSAVRQFLDYCESPDELTFSRFGRLVTNESGMMCLQNWERTKKILLIPFRWCTRRIFGVPFEFLFAIDFFICLILISLLPYVVLCLESTSTRCAVEGVDQAFLMSGGQSM